MQVFFDFLPVIAFVGAYWLTDLHTAIGVIMVAVTLQIAITWIIKRTVPKMLLVSAVLVIGLGGISLLLQNDLIFKWKPTVVNWLFGAVFLGSQFIGERPVVQRLLESVATEPLHLPAPGWRQLNLMWALFFFVSGAANIFVAYRFSEPVWVNFKLFGLLGMTLVFVILQGIWLSRHISQKAEGPTGDG